MNAVSFPFAPAWVGKLLAILSVTFFWCLPWSPVVAIAAIIATRQASGWPRKLAVAGATLSAALTIVFAIAICWSAVKVWG